MNLVINAYTIICLHPLLCLFHILDRRTTAKRVSARPVQGSISEEVGALLSNPIILGLPLISFWKTVEIKTQVSPTRGVLKRPATDPELPTTKVGHWTMSIKVAAALVLP